MIRLLPTEFSLQGEARVPLLLSKLMFASSTSKLISCGSKKAEQWPVSLCVPAVFYTMETQADKEPAMTSGSPGDPSLTVPRNIEYKDSVQSGPSQSPAVLLKVTDFTYIVIP